MKTVALPGLPTQVLAASPTFEKPFSPYSIWKREIRADAEYADVQEAIWGDAEQAIDHVRPDLLLIEYVNTLEPLVDFRLNQGWHYPERSIPEGEVLFQRRLSAVAGTGLRLPNTGNGNFVIIDLETGLLDQGTAGWREPGGDFLTFFDDEKLHNNNVLKSNGFYGTRASNLHVLGGAIRSGEINTVIEHVVAVNLNGRRFSKDRHFVWPASGADSYADDPEWGYAGPDPNYTMGTLLAIPHDFDLDSVVWQTPQGRVLAKAAQDYGWYIVDNSGGTLLNLSIERQAAYEDIGLTIDENNDQKVDPEKLDYEGFLADMVQILHIVKAVTNNGPDIINNNAPVLQEADPINMELFDEVNIIPSVTDADADYITYSLVQEPTKGHIKYLNSYYIYKPYEAGQDSFTIRAYDGQSYSNEVTFIINVSIGASTISIYTNQASYHPGDTLVAIAHVSNGPDPVTVRVGVSLILPGAIKLTILNERITFPGNDDTDYEIFHYTFWGDEPIGQYNIEATLDGIPSANATFSFNP